MHKNLLKNCGQAWEKLCKSWGVLLALPTAGVGVQQGGVRKSAVIRIFYAVFPTTFPRSKSAFLSLLAHHLSPQSTLPTITTTKLLLNYYY